MCLAPQRHAIFPHRNFKKWSEHVATNTFWLKMCFSLERRALFPHRNFKKWSEHAVFYTFWFANMLLATAAWNFSTSQLQKVVRECCVLLVHFDLKMCFSLQGRAIFPHRNFKKWSEHVATSTFWLENVLLATAACNFSTSQFQKVAPACSLLRYSGVKFFHIAISKSGPRMLCFAGAFWLENLLLATAACNFSTSQLQKVVRTCSDKHILIENVLLATTACDFSCLL